MNHEQWRPGSDKDLLRARAVLLKTIRTFFEQHKVLEVETPVLSNATGTDLNLEPITAAHPGDSEFEPRTLYLQTSPEFAMKRLLAAGSGPIFQICKAFRSAETGIRHNPEFTLLEWYQPGYDEHQLMDELMELVCSLFPKDHLVQKPWQRLSFQDLFEGYLGINPHTATAEELADRLKKVVEIEFQTVSKDVWLNLLFSHLIEPQLQTPVFIYDYPTSQAALARIDKNDDGIDVARRFELVMGGMEIANGYFELTDAEEQRQRFMTDLRLRQQQGKKPYPIDENLLAAMKQGLPDCAGVAVGLDRLLMLICGVDSIDQVLSFSLEKA